MKGILLIGEPMGLMIAQEEGSLEKVSSFSAAVAGAELNVAIGLARLGHPVQYLTQVGEDPFGKRILNTLQENRISTDGVKITSQFPTGFMLKGKVKKGDPGIAYFRKGSAASRLSVNDLKDLDISAFSFLHLTGIFPALSDSCRELTFFLAKKAKEAGLKISFDPNLRPQLWECEHQMRETLNALAEYADLILPGVSEGKTLTGNEDPAAIARFYLDRGAKAVVVKIGKEGAYAASSHRCFTCPTYYEDRLVDTVGAGDGFAVGVLSALNEGASLQEAVLRGNAIGTLQIQNAGDNEGLPTPEQLETFMKTHKLRN